MDCFYQSSNLLYYKWTVGLATAQLEIIPRGYIAKGGDNSMVGTTETMEDLAAVFKIFGDYTRLTILSLLMDHEELCVGDIAERLNMTQSGVSHQLALLKQSKLVKTKREGKSIFYSIADEHVSAIIRIGMEHVLEE